MKSKFKYDYGNYKYEGVEYKVPDFDDLKANSAEWRNKISLLPVNAPEKVIGRYKYFSWNINKHIRKGEKNRRTTEVIRDLTVMLEESSM